jgi:regulator of protease activity HflC (stomatin/prohibitin superfamily)
MINRILKILGVFAALGVILAALILLFGLTKVEPNEVGVRVNNIPYFHDVKQNNITKPGYYFTIPKLYVIYKVPGTLMTIYMVEQGDIKFKSGSGGETVPTPTEAKPEPDKADEMEKLKREMSEVESVNTLVHKLRSGKESVWVKTADGNDVWVPIIVSYEIKPEQAHLALQNIGLKRGDFKKDIEALVNSVVRGKVRAYLSQLRTTRFENAAEEEQSSILNDKAVSSALTLARDQLNAVLGNKYGLNITALEALDPVLHPDFDRALQRQNNALALATKYEYDARKAEKLAETRRFEAKGQADAMVTAAKSRQEVAHKEGDAQLLAKQHEAEAEGVRTKNLADGIGAITAQLDRAGGDKQVGLAVARALKGKRIIIVPSEGALNLLDVNEILQSYGAANLILNKNKAGANPDAGKSTEKPAGDAAGKKTESSLKDLPPTGANETPNDKDTTGIEENVVGPPLDEPVITAIPEDQQPATSNP